MSPSPVSSTPVLRTALVWGAGIGLGVMIVAGVIGGVAAGPDGLWSAVIGASIGIVFPALTAVSILVANRWYGSPSYLTIFFGVVLGGWLLKFVLVIVLMLVLLQFSWIVPLAFYFSLVAAAVASLVVDLLVIRTMRLPAVSDAVLPGNE